MINAECSHPPVETLKTVMCHTCGVFKLGGVRQPDVAIWPAPSRRTIIILRDEDGTDRSYDLAIPHERPPAIVLLEDGRPFLLTDKSERDPDGEWIYVQPSWSKVTRRV